MLLLIKRACINSSFFFIFIFVIIGTNHHIKDSVKNLSHGWIGVEFYLKKKLNSKIFQINMKKRKYFF